MNITIVAVGKLKEAYLQEAVQEYLKRLSRYAKIQVVEVPEERAKEPLSDAEIEHILNKEGERILQHLQPNSYCIASAIEGKSISSTTLAQNLHDLTTYGESHLTFVIGGSYGLSSQVIQKAQYLLSFSAFTFPHQLMRVLLLEQVYRAFKINRGESYHK
jgi:23S rRNA (pseudouridine1915-N3)-methyltransferase